MNRPRWRLIVDPPAAGAWNMAVDETVLDSADRQPGPPTLRLYSWRPAALSLGAHQPPTYDPWFLREQGIQLVRRPTGGLAVLHEHECTYSVSGGLRGEAFSGGVLETYLCIAEALVGALARLGVEAQISGRLARMTMPTGCQPAACFGRTSSHEIRVAGLKLIGSAQRRRAGAFLQHGSIPLSSDPVRLSRALGGGVGDPSTDLGRVLGRPVDTDALTSALIGGFEQRFGASLIQGSLSDDEREAATRLYSRKYLSSDWTFRGGVARGRATRRG